MPAVDGSRKEECPKVKLLADAHTLMQRNTENRLVSFQVDKCRRVFRTAQMETNRKERGVPRYSSQDNLFIRLK